MSTAVVYNFVDLKANALDPDVDLIYLGAHINIESGGISLIKNKPSLVIDGHYPIGEMGTNHTLVDYLSNAQSNAIRVGTVAGAFSLTLKNCTFVGRNYYGALSTTDSSLNANTVLKLENVDYSGPQAAYNRHGQVIIEGGSYRIGVYNGTTAVTNETVEANSVVLSGTVSIHHDGALNSCFWLTNGSPKLRIAENAAVSVETTQRELIYNDAAYVEIVLEANSYFYVNTFHGMFYNAAMCATTLLLQEGAQLIFDQKVNQAGVATIQITQGLVMQDNSRLIIMRKYASSDPLILFSSGASAQFNNPKSVVLYNRSGRVLSWRGGTGTINISAQMVRYWLVAAAVADAGGFDDIPLYHWQKADQSNATISATVSSSATTSVSSNLIVGVDAPVVPTTSSFSVYACRVLAFGSLPLTVQQVTESMVDVRGTTYPNALIRVTTIVATTNTQADAQGQYDAVVATPMSKGAEISVGANQDFKTVYIQVLAEGVLEFLYLPATLPFKTVALPARRQISLRKDDNWSIIVHDSRTNGSQWYLYAHAPLPMSTDTADLPNDSLVFVAAATLPLNQQVLIYSGEGNTSSDFTDTTISWQQVEGILLSLNPLLTYEAGHYVGAIFFSLSDVPL